MRIESRYAEVLHIAAECAAENAALKAEAEWAGATIALLVGENENLAADLDDMQAEWAKAELMAQASDEWRVREYIALKDAWNQDSQIDRAHIARLEADIAELIKDNTRLRMQPWNEGLRAVSLEAENKQLLETVERLSARVKWLEDGLGEDSPELRAAKQYIATLEQGIEGDQARLVQFGNENDTLSASLAEQTRLRIAAFERNAELETAAPALEALIRKQTDGELIRQMHAVLRLLQPPKAPSVPRRTATPGLEVGV